MEKRISCRAIIFKDDSIITMHRIKESDEYYTYPGGGLEKNESLEDCVIRETKEEFGINVKPIKLVYEYHNKDSIQYFYLCEWIDGTFGTGKGPEMINYKEENGHYIPTMIEVSKMGDIKFQPIILTKQLLNDIDRCGKVLDDKAKIIEDSN